MRTLIVVSLFLISFTANACEDSTLSFEIKFKDGIRPTSTEPGTVLLIVPLEYKWWKLNDATYVKGKNKIPVQKTQNPDYPDKGVYFFQGTSDLFKDSFVRLNFYPISREMPDGSFRKVACIYTKDVRWNI